MSNEILRKIPKMDTLLAHPAIAECRDEYGHAAVLSATRNVLDNLRESCLRGETAIPTNDALAAQVVERVRREGIPSLRRVINATGVLLHTNLGRAPLAECAAQRAIEVACGYSTLEYSVLDGGRGSRHAHVARLLSELTGAEDAMVVNNNAAAVLLMLTVMAKGRDVVISRGELIEIGGSFRIPDIMALSGVILREVGTTNRTRIEDYAAAIGEQTGALMKAHTSNYKIVGFTQEASLAELADLGHEHGIPVLYDLGSGTLLPMQDFAMDEPRVADCVQKGADVLCFSGDKLLGGPQAGILLGRKAHIARMKTHPLARALRVDKMTLAALEATLCLYRDPTRAMEEIPVLRMLSEPVEALRGKAERLVSLLGFLSPAPVVLEEPGRVGGGTAPGETLPSVAVALASDRGADWLMVALRRHEPPIIARVARELLLLDMRTVEEADFPRIVECLRGAVLHQV